jgi:hypothetical protein
MTQSQEQVHTVAAQVCTSVKQSCINLQDASTGAQTSPKALGDLLCNVNIVWFKVHIRNASEAGCIHINLHEVRQTSSPALQSLQFWCYDKSIGELRLTFRKSLALLVHGHSEVLSVDHISQSSVTPASIRYFASSYDTV